tara:strand:- start:40 stop:2829 length:2790 start_codon:yes stop_codon:yes gene_type:complete
MSSITVKAEQISLAGFTGTLTTTVSSGFSMRTEENDCRLISGDSLAIKGSVEDRSSMLALNAVGYYPDNGNGGCNVYETDSYGNTSSKSISRVNSNQDDGKLNFGKGDVFDAGNTLSLGFFGSNDSGVKLNISGLAYYNAALDISAPAFSTITGKAKDEFENQFKLGNAFIETPLNDNVSITFGNYVQSQGVTALLPIGVNVANPVSLPILRSPGASLKDALLPQSMLGVTAFLDGGVTLEAYYQLEQAEVEIDVARSFNGSDFVGRHNVSSLMNSPNYRENPNIPFAGSYHDVATCLSDTVAAGATGCGDSGLWAGLEADGTGTPTASGETGLYTLVNLMANGTLVQGNLDAIMAGFNAVNDENALGNYGDATDYDSLITSALHGSASVLTFSAPGAQNTGTTLTNDQIKASLTRMATQYDGIGNTASLVSVRRAPDSYAKSSGQFGINLSGYLDNVGSGLEWGLYYNNSHSNSPRIRFLAIEDGYASTLFATFSVMNGTANFGDATVSPYEQVLGNTAYSDLVCGLIHKAATGSSPAYGTYYGSAGTRAYVHDPEKCYYMFDNVYGPGAWAADYAKRADPEQQHVYGGGPAGIAAAVAATHAQATGAANGALATLGFTNASRYQLYYPEDIKTMGLSLATGLGSWATNLEVAYRPDFPMQIAVPDLLLGLIDSQGGTMVQSLASYATASTANKNAIAAANAISLQKWSATPNCDISSATGISSTDISGYAVCDGTAEHDVWTMDVNAARSFTASDPISQSTGADGGSLLIEIGAVMLPTYDHAQGLVATNHQSFGHDVYGGGCLDIAGTSALSVQSNGLFGDGYCENNSGPDDLAMTSRIRGALNYFNFNNSPWTFSPSIGIDYDFLGNAPASMGGWVEGEASVTLGTSFSNGGTTAKLNYVAELGNYADNASSDRDYISASVTHAF